MKKTSLPIIEFILSSEEDGVIRNSLVFDPANETHWIALSKEEPIVKLSRDEMKRNITGPLLIPDQRIHRNGGKNGPFLGFFSRSTIEEIAKRYAKDLRFANVNLEHDSEVTGTYIIELWITGERDKSQDLGFEFPPGTLMVTMHVENDEIWNMILSGEIRGFSIEGRFGANLVEASEEKPETTPETTPEKNEEQRVQEFFSSLTSDDLTDDEKLALIKNVLLDGEK